jgi:hypothetical protein
MPKHTNLNCQCASCKSKRGEYKGINNPNHKHGKYINNKKCIICGIKISINAQKCNKCVGKDRQKIMKTILRTKEWIKNQAKAEIGKIISKETRKRISLGLGGTGIPFENKIYPLDFYLIRPIILQRDNNKCQLCHKVSNLVHHIDYNKKNCKENNLITLCRGCNSKVNINRDYWFAYFAYFMENNHAKS